MKSKLLIVCFAVTIAVTGLAHAGFPTASTSAAPEVSGVELMRLFQSLDLAPEQKHYIVVIINDHRPDIRAEVDRLMSARERLFAAIGGGGGAGGEADVRDAARAVAAAEEALAVLRARVNRAVADVLTEEQAGLVQSFRGDVVERGKDRVMRVRSFVDRWLTRHSAN